MSIVTLKKKTQHKYNNSSVGYAQFSLNGTHRSQGWVGQTSLSRSLPRTLMCGNVIRGHGGCCGKYHIAPVVISGIYSTDDSKKVKSTVMGNAGMLMTKYRWTRRPQPFSTTKFNSLNNLNTQSIYITNKKRAALNNFNKCDVINRINGVYVNKSICASGSHNTACASLIGFKNNNYNILNPSSRKVQNFSKPFSVISCSDNIVNINSICVANDKLENNLNHNKTPLIGS